MHSMSLLTNLLTFLGITDLLRLLCSPHVIFAAVLVFDISLLAVRDTLNLHKRKELTTQNP